MMKYESHEWHAKMVCDGMRSGKRSNGLNRSFVHEAGERTEGELSASRVARFSALAATAKYLAADEIRHEMATPMSWRGTSRSSRRWSWTTAGRQRGDQDAIHVFAGCPRPRQSERGRLAVVHGVEIKQWSAISSGCGATERRGRMHQPRARRVGGSRCTGHWAWTSLWNTGRASRKAFRTIRLFVLGAVVYMFIRRTRRLGGTSNT